MTLPVATGASGIQDSSGVTATAKISTNWRASGLSGPLSLATDVLLFPGPNISGNWVVPATRVRVQGIPVITTASGGVAIAPGPSPVITGPLRVAQPDQRLKAH